MRERPSPATLPPTAPGESRGVCWVRGSRSAPGHPSAIDLPPFPHFAFDGPYARARKFKAGLLEAHLFSSAMIVGVGCVAVTKLCCWDDRWAGQFFVLAGLQCAKKRQNRKGIPVSFPKKHVAPPPGAAAVY